MLGVDTFFLHHVYVLLAFPLAHGALASFGSCKAISLVHRYEARPSPVGEHAGVHQILTASAADGLVRRGGHRSIVVRILASFNGPPIYINSYWLVHNAMLLSVVLALQAFLCSLCGLFSAGLDADAHVQYLLQLFLLPGARLR